MSKVWLITGSASGLGRNIAEAVLASGGRCGFEPVAPAKFIGSARVTHIRSRRTHTTPAMVVA